MRCLTQLNMVPMCNFIRICTQQAHNLMAVPVRNTFLRTNCMKKSFLRCRHHSTEDTPKPLRTIKSKSSQNNVYSFVDMRNVRVIAGNGGDGAVSFLRICMNDHAGPDGGDGGNGGHVIFKASANTSDLMNIDSVVKADCGENGSTRDCFGRNAKHKIVSVPIGTLLRDKDGKVVADLDQEGMMYVAARGGAGGHGNAYFKSAVQQSPQICEYGAIGENMEYTLEVKTMAHFGLIGYPNAGKSTLLRAITRARPKVSYVPFTTMNPYLGVVLYDDYEQLRVADLPGIIPGSHKNMGLGIRFLKHAERCFAFLHILDVTIKEPWVQLETLQYEISQFNDNLKNRDLIVVANKIDLPEAAENLEQLKERIQLPIIPISAKCGTNISTLLIEMRKIYDRINSVNKNEEKDVR